MEKSVFDHRPDSHLCARIELLDCHRQQVGAGVSQSLQALGSAWGDDADLGILLQYKVAIDGPAIDPSGHGGPRKIGADVRGEFMDGE